MFSTFVNTTIMTSVSVLKMVVTSAFKPYVPSYALDSSHVQGGVVVESERLHLCGCHWSRL